jgi:phosphoribosylaminoimidazole-succinocarboxamide synthase
VDRLTPPLTPSDLPGLPLLARGKVRDLYAVGDDAVLVVTSDRISAYDAVLPTEIPDKGAVLTAMTVWWLEQLDDLVPTHLLTARAGDFPPELAPVAAALGGRAMLCRRLDMLAVECVARGYLTGSGLSDYRATGGVCGHALPPGLRDGDRLPEPIFTPATKAEVGSHDENVDRAAVAAAVGEQTAAELERLTLEVYRRARDVAAARGLLLADTKLEFGRPAGSGDVGPLVLGDEVLTPDSSRWWPRDAWEARGPDGGAPASYDKQFVRNWLTSAGWDRTSPPPPLPDDVVAATRGRYVSAYERLTGRSFAAWVESS